MYDTNVSDIQTWGRMFYLNIHLSTQYVKTFKTSVYAMIFLFNIDKTQTTSTVEIIILLFYELGDEESTFDLIRGTTTAAGVGCLALFEDSSWEESSIVSTTVNRSSS
jgi:hypothetical protein